MPQLIPFSCLSNAFILGAPARGGRGGARGGRGGFSGGRGGARGGSFGGNLIFIIYSNFNLMNALVMHRHLMEC